MDTLELANDYVNLSWEEFEAKYKDLLKPSVIGIPGRPPWSTGNCGKVFPSAVTVRSA